MWFTNVNHDKTVLECEYLWGNRITAESPLFVYCGDNRWYGRIWDETFTGRHCSSKTWFGLSTWIFFNSTTICLRIFCVPVPGKPSKSRTFGSFTQSSKLHAVHGRTGASWPSQAFTQQTNHSSALHLLGRWQFYRPFSGFLKPFSFLWLGKRHASSKHCIHFSLVRAWSLAVLPVCLVL